MRRMFAAAMFVCTVALPASAQDQQPRDRPGWPCSGHPDATYFQTAEATGGQVFLFHPSEVAGSGMLMAAGMRHEATLFRVAGSLQEGLHAFSFPVDASVESVLVSVSLQCLQVVEIAKPDGTVVQASDPATAYEAFEAGRVVTVGAPAAGEWTVRVSGRGLFFLVVQAKTPLSIGGVQVVRKDVRDGREVLTPVYTALPPGARAIVRLHVPDGARDVRARLVSAAFEDIAPLALGRADGEGAGAWSGAFTVPARGFRVVVNGVDENGRPFQRVHAPLFQVAGAK